MNGCIRLRQARGSMVMGAKMFAWIGGFALFLGVAFFVKYSFEHNLIPPELRVAIGFLAGIALVGGGVLLKRKENVITAQTLCATGILILYAVTFACRAFYHFPFFGLIPTFALMAASAESTSPAAGRSFCNSLKDGHSLNGN